MRVIGHPAPMWQAFAGHASDHRREALLAMHYQALATDYDGTLAKDGQVDEAVLAALQALRASGRRLILISGREHQDLLRVFPNLHVFDRVVLENGAVLTRPAEGDAVCFGEPPPPSFVESLRRRNVSPLSTGDVIVSSWEPNETAVLECIRELGLEYQVIFNKGAVMVLPPGINKASGLRAALKDLQLSPHNVVGIGNAENDQSFMQICGCSVAVGNALPSIKETSDIVTDGARGNGVREIAGRLIENDLADVPLSASRHRVILGEVGEGGEIMLPVRGSSVLVAGSSGSGKSTLIQALLERLAEREYQYCVIDPEGDYEHLAATLVAGSREHAPDIAQVIENLEQPDVNLAVNLLAIALAERPAFIELLSALLQLRVRVGRPHWTVIDEAHHMLPAADAPSGIAPSLGGMVFVTVHPDQLSMAALAVVDLVIAVGATSRDTIEMFCQQLGRPTPPLPNEPLLPEEALAWTPSAGASPVRITAPKPRGERRRHIRKYAEGHLGEDKSFYFRGPDGLLNLRAQNLGLFVQMADGVDDATWLHHLRAGDYSRWLRESIKDLELAAEAEQAEADPEADPSSTRQRIR
jgi:hydroxymethylpyrimidine pyrophosphatase-like HAD family hydrolase/energy-coupling factor transporter ATP-binding protein EcfA2